MTKDFWEVHEEEALEREQALREAREEEGPFRIYTFGSPEEMFRAIREDREEADRRIRGWQRGVKPGDKVLRIHGGLIIAGEILDPPPLEEERKLPDLSDPEEAEELRYAEEMYGPRWKESYRFGRFYSVCCPEGELGDIHLSQIFAVLTERQWAEHLRETQHPGEDADTGE